LFGRCRAKPSDKKIVFRVGKQPLSQPDETAGDELLEEGQVDELLHLEPGQPNRLDILL
jgi:hypothetical protein